MHTTMVQKTLVRPSFGTDFMPNCTNIAVFLVFVLDILTLFCNIAAIHGVKEKTVAMTLCTMLTTVSEKMLSLLS